MTTLFRRNVNVLMGVLALSLAIGLTHARPPMAVKFKIVNKMGTAVRVRLVHFGATFVTDIAKDAEYLSKPTESLLVGERAVIVFDNPTGQILLQGKKDITADVKIVLDPAGVGYSAL